MKFFSKAHQSWVEGLLGAIQSHYAENLTTLAVFGSYARGEHRFNSDLDLLIVLKKDSSASRLKRQEDFVQNIELPLDPSKDKLEAQNIHMELSSMIVTQAEAISFNPLYLDMVEYCHLVIDRNQFFHKILKQTEKQMKKWGSQKHFISGHWYWEIKPGLKWNEVLHYDQ